MKLYSPTLPRHQGEDPGSQLSPYRPEGFDPHGWDTPPFMPGDPEGLLFAQEMRRRAEDAAIEEAARNVVLSRRAQRRADALEREASGAADSWKPVDLAELFDEEQEEPDVGSFLEGDTSNGGGIFYSGKVNEIHGPSESGKTMVVLAVAAQEIRAGNHVVMVDFEDGGKSIVGRLHWIFNLSREEIIEQFHYFQPETHFTEEAYQSIASLPDVTLGIVDAVTESMSAADLDGRNENEVATWYNGFPKRLARLGMAVCVIDHSPQDNGTRQIGSQHKKSAVDGVSYTAEPISPFVKGQRGKLRLKIAKDKPGGVRPQALPQGEGRQFWRGDFEIDGRAGSDTPRVALYGVDPALFDIPDNRPDLSQKDVKPVIPPPSEAVVLEILAESTEWMSAQAVTEWHNDKLDPKDPKRMKRTVPRKMAVKLIGRGLAERRESAGSIAYRITPMGLHSANAVASEKARNPQMDLLETDENPGFMNPGVNPGS